MLPRRDAGPRLGAARHALQRDGFCVIRRLVPASDVEQLLDMAAVEARSLEHMAHSEAMWRLRTNVAVMNAFATLWDVPPCELIVGFDGMLLDQASHVVGWHVDQDGSHDNVMDGIQCIVALAPSDSETGSVRFLRGSHMVFEYAVEACPRKTGKWEATFLSDRQWMYRNLDVCMPALRAGDAVFWDSRTLHSVPPARRPGAHRSVAFLSYSPRHLATDDVLRRRRDAHKRGVHTTHWPHRFVARNGACSRPSRYTDTVPSDVRQRLVG